MKALQRGGYLLPGWTAVRIEIRPDDVATITTETPNGAPAYGELEIDWNMLAYDLDFEHHGPRLITHPS